ncbi:MAG TPA: allantoinase AllB [Nitrososphaerales archaeon]|nr:allantoinase AllB [Nitrososphaerales archaeon]
MPPNADLTIKNGRIVTPSQIYRAAISVKDGKIVAITSTENALAADIEIDASDLYILPGVIDAHVHLRDPGYTNKEDFSTGTASAAAGGVTCVLDMPNNSPPVKDVAALERKISEAGKKAIVDYGLYGLLTEGSLEHVAPLARKGVIGYKCYMGETVGKIPPPSDGELLDQLSTVSPLNLRVAVHAENDSILKYRIARLRESGRVDAHAHYESRPEVVEEEAISRAVLFAAETKCKLHIAHLSSARGVAILEAAKKRREPVTAETCPHYLTLEDSQYSTLGALMKMNPSIKTRTDQAALWTALNLGIIDMISTDHSPHMLEEKEAPVIFDCISGFPGLETSVPLMLTHVNAGRISLNRYVQVSSENPAKAWGLFPTKGCIEIGSDADLTIVDMNAKARVDASKFCSKAKWSPFDGFEVQGIPKYTVVRGCVVMANGQVEKNPTGRMVIPHGFAYGQAPAYNLRLGS